MRVVGTLHAGVARGVHEQRAQLGRARIGAAVRLAVLLDEQSDHAGRGRGRARGAAQRAVRLVVARRSRPHRIAAGHDLRLDPAVAARSEAAHVERHDARGVNRVVARRCAPRPPSARSWPAPRRRSARTAACAPARVRRGTHRCTSPRDSAPRPRHPEIAALVARRPHHRQIAAPHQRVDPGASAVATEQPRRCARPRRPTTSAGPDTRPRPTSRASARRRGWKRSAPGASASTSARSSNQSGPRCAPRAPCRALRRCPRRCRRWWPSCAWRARRSRPDRGSLCARADRRGWRARRPSSQTPTRTPLPCRSKPCGAACGGAGHADQARRARHCPRAAGARARTA